MPERAPTPSLTVIVPAYNAPAMLERSLAALRASTAAFELIVADDASTDPRTAEVARAAGAKVVRLERNSGPGVARNTGAKQAAGEVLAFVDSDVVVHPDALDRLLAALAADPAASAVFGSYDDRPDAKGLVTEYRNLLHHFVHHHGPREATTFWAGLGAIRRAAFEEVGGYDPAFRYPSIEDIDLGMRLKAAGKRILLLPEIQATHLKRWRFAEMIRVDVTRRAIPWAKLLRERPGTGGDLNLERTQKVAAAFVALAILAVPASATAVACGWSPWWLVAPLAALAPVVWINRELYALFFRHGGPAFALGAFLLHLLYYVYSSLAWLWVALTHRPG